MNGAKAAKTTVWVMATLVMVGSLATPERSVLAHGPENTEDPLTRFEHFQLEACSPCVTETAAITTLPVPSLKLAGASRTAAGRTTRAGEVVVEAIRAHLLGRPTRQMLAVRLTLSVATGNPGGEMYRIASGVVDEEEVGSFVSGLEEMTRAAATATPDDHTSEIDLRSGSLRIGVLRVKGELIVYVQAGDVRAFARRFVSDVPTTLYLPVADLAALRNAIAQAAIKIQQLRRGP
jgi:hypothetical protein